MSPPRLAVWARDGNGTSHWRVPSASVPCDAGAWLTVSPFGGRTANEANLATVARHAGENALLQQWINSLRDSLGRWRAGHPTESLDGIGLAHPALAAIQPTRTRLERAIKEALPGFRGGIHSIVSCLAVAVQVLAEADSNTSLSRQNERSTAPIDEAGTEGHDSRTRRVMIVRTPGLKIGRTLGVAWESCRITGTVGGGGRTLTFEPEWFFSDPREAFAGASDDLPEAVQSAAERFERHLRWTSGQALRVGTFRWERQSTVTRESESAPAELPPEVTMENAIACGAARWASAAFGDRDSRELTSWQLKAPLPLPFGLLGNLRSKEGSKVVFREFGARCGQPPIRIHASKAIIAARHGFRALEDSNPRWTRCSANALLTFVGRATSVIDSAGESATPHEIEFMKRKPGDEAGLWSESLPVLWPASGGASVAG